MSLALPPASGDDDVHLCVPLPPDACANAYVVPDKVGAEVYLREIARTGQSAVTSMAVHDGRLYVAHLDGTVVSTNGSAWRDEARVPLRYTGGCADLVSLASFDGSLYATSSSTRGPWLWRLGASGWTSVIPNMGPGCHAYDVHVYNDKLYVGTSGSRVYQYAGGSALTLVLDIGMSTSGAVTAFAHDDEAVYAATFRGLYKSSTGGSWTPIGSPSFRASGLVASGGDVWASSGSTLYRVSGNGAEAARSWPGTALDKVADAFGHPAPSIAKVDTLARLARFDGHGTTTLVEGWGQMTAAETFEDQLYVGRAIDGTVLRLHLLVDARPLPP